ncbi:MAG: deoxyguanosinetriphosphate triphosphohydrolase [Planctomycetota bacterium]
MSRGRSSCWSCSRAASAWKPSPGRLPARTAPIITIDSNRIEHDEAARLPLYALRSTGSRGRRHPEPPDPLRTVWRRDRDRIVHCGAFRRLEYKTQVFVFHEGDHYRTRLTHTLEVAQVARSVAVVLGLNESFVEALALAHDLGHPPFGHAGEDVLRLCMKESGGFEHNAQALRVVDFLERGYPQFRGLNLSYEIRASLLKHGPGAAGGVGSDIEPAPFPLLEAQVVDVADSIAYNNHDLDDGLRSGLLTPSDLEELGLWRRAQERARALYPTLEGALLTRSTRAQVIKITIDDLITHTSANLERLAPRNPEAARAHGRLVGFSPPMQELVSELQRFLLGHLYRAHAVTTMRQKTMRIVRELFEIYLHDPEQMAPDFREMAGTAGVYRAAADYVAGMTDRFAEQEHERLTGLRLTTQGN